MHCNISLPPLDRPALCQPVPSSVQAAGPASGMGVHPHPSSFAPEPHLYEQEICYLSSCQRKKH